MIATSKEKYPSEPIKLNESSNNETLQSVKSESAVSSDDVSEVAKWLIAHPGSRSNLLQFHNEAVAEPPTSPPARRLNMTYKTCQTETKLLAAILRAHGFTEVDQNDQEYNLMWTGAHPKPQQIRSLLSFQRVNHFPRSFELTRKDRLYKNIERMQRSKGSRHFDIVPQSFVMPGEFKQLQAAHHRSRGPWIVKPFASSRGRGIFIVNEPNQVPLEERVLVAKYIADPLLVDGHKCDLRLYVAVTSFDPLVIYLYEEGLARLAAVKYRPGGDHLWNPCMHLCNTSVNKYHSDYRRNEDAEAEDRGHKRTLSSLLRALRLQGADTAALMARVEDLVIKAILASAPSISSACHLLVPHPANCFELYGFDVLIDSSLKPWLLEVNLSPSLGCDSPLDLRVKSALIADLLTLVGIPALEPSLRKSRTTRFASRNESIGSRRAAPNPNGLTSEENRSVRLVREQFARRGGFVRIFPATESWRRYSSFLEPPCGLNLILHQQLYPEEHAWPAKGTRASTGDALVAAGIRLGRYERALRNSLKTADGSILVSSQAPESDSTADEPKQKFFTLYDEGSRLSDSQARRLLTNYLVLVLRRVTGGQGDGDVVLRFVQKAAATTLRTQPYFGTLPHKNLDGKDRIAFIAKQLSDFIYQYNRETELFYQENPMGISYVPDEIFQNFLHIASEADLAKAVRAEIRRNESKRHLPTSTLLQLLDYKAKSSRSN